MEPENAGKQTANSKLEFADSSLKPFPLEHIRYISKPGHAVSNPSDHYRDCLLIPTNRTRLPGEL